MGWLDTRTARDAAPHLRDEKTLARASQPRETRFVLTLATDGKVIAEVDPMPRIDTDGTIHLGGSRLEFVRDGEVTPLPTGPPKLPKRQAIEAHVSDHDVMWMETPSTDLEFQQMYAYCYDAHDGRTHLLWDSSATVPKGRVPVPPGTTVATIAGATAYWTAPYPTDSDVGFGTEIISRDCAARSPARVVVRGAKLPAADGSELYYVRTHDIDPATPADRYEIRRHDARGDALVASGHLNAPRTVPSLVAHDGALAWVVSEGDEAAVLHYRAPSGHTDTIALHDSGMSTIVSIGDGIVAWGNGSGNGDAGEYVYSVADRAIWHLADSFGLSRATVGGLYLDWATLDEHQRGVDHLARWKP